VAAADAVFDTAKKTYQRVKGLADEGLVAQQKADEAEMAYRSAAAQLQAAKAKLDLVKAGARPQEIDAAREQVSQAKAALEVARNTHSMAKEGPRKQEIAAAEEQVRQAAAGVDAAQRTLKLAQDAHLMVNIRQKDVEAAAQKVAAGAGVVREVQAYQNQTRIVSPITGRISARFCRGGEIIAPGYALLSVAREDGYWVRVYVDESKFAGHHVGERVTVNIPALGNEVSGHLSRLLPASDFATKRANNERGSFDARALELRITLDAPLTEMASGMTARVRFSAGRH
jgi:HlyD family secretion protein